MTGARPCTRADLPRVAELHHENFLARWNRSPAPPEAFEAVFFDYPDKPEDAHSIVYEDEAGVVQGFIGSVERAASFGDRPLRISIATLLMVGQEARSGPAAGQIIRAYIEGPQDVKLADEANVLSRVFWNRVGGFCALPLSLRWRRILRPAARALAGGARRMAGAGAASLAAGLAAPLDRFLAGREEASALCLPDGCRAEAIGAETLTAELREAARRPAVALRYSPELVDWTLARAQGRVRPGGRLRTMALRDEKGLTLGCWVTVQQSDGYAEVLLLLARRRQEERVFQSLSHCAWRDGAVALEGRLESWMLQEPAVMRSLRYGTGLWTCLHTRDEDLAQAFRAGDVLLPVLDGEYPLGIG